MNKCTPEKLKNAADDLNGWLHRNPDVVRVEPEITRIIVSARDKAYEKWREVTEREPRERPNYPALKAAETRNVKQAEPK